MRKLLGGLLMIFIVACTKERYQAHGTLTGVDPGSCTCCGGVILVIDNDPAQYRIDTLRFMTWQQLSGMTFPRRISFDYEVKTVCGPSTFLNITQYITRK